MKTSKIVKLRAARNRTITLDNREMNRLSGRLIIPGNDSLTLDRITNKIVFGDLFSSIRLLPKGFVDLIFIDPPYNLSKEFNGSKFKKMADASYESWMTSWLEQLVRILKPTASVYICC